uniref:PH domain-containing protein n=1 Tax=Prymnesium polylepis TaxID=72548 RepID=A0A7S4M1K3_9EUKA
MSPFKAGGSNSDDDSSEQQPETIADKAKSWLSMATAPIATMQAQRAESAAHQQRAERLKAGAQMQLLPSGRGEVCPVRVALSNDVAMVTWQGGTESGVLALSAVREVKPILASGLFKAGGPVPCQWMMVADDQTVRLEAESEAVKEEWMQAIEVLRNKEGEAKTGRKMAYQAKRRIGMEERKREAERRKAEVLKTCSAGGMRHTANAMMNRA